MLSQDILQEVLLDVPLESAFKGLEFLMWIPALTIIPILGFLVLYLRRAMNTKQSMYGYLTGLFVCSMLSHILSMNFLFNNQNLSIIIYKSAQIAEITSSFLLLLILQLFENSRIVSKISTFFTISFSIIIYAIISDNNMDTMQLGGFQSVGFEQGGTVSILIAVFSGVALIWLIRIYFQNQKGLENSTQKRIITYLFLGIIMTIFMGSFLPTILEFILTGNSMMRMNNFSVFRTIGLILVGMGYSKVGEKTWLLQRQKNQFLIVYNKAGLPLYQRSFDDTISEENMSLFSGAFSAITTMFQHTANISEPIEAIQFHGKILKVITTEKFYCMLMTDYLSPVSVQALEKFSDVFATKFELLLKDMTGECVALEPANQISDTFFP